MALSNSTNARRNNCVIDLGTIDFKNADAVIYLGCGDLQQLPDLPDFTHLVLIDADSSIVDLLQAQYSNQPKITCLHRVISMDGSERKFNYFNLDSFNGFSEEKAIRALYPGIKLRESEEVKTTDVTQVIEELNLARNAKNVLLVDIPSLNSQLLKKLRDSGQLYHFQLIKAYQQVENLFRDEGSASDLVAWFLDNGFLAQQQFTSNPDFALITAHTNPLHSVDKSLHHEIKTRKLNESAPKSEQTTRILHLELEKSDLLKIIEEKDKELANLELERDKTKSERDSARAECDSQREQVKQLAKQIEKTTSLLDSKLSQVSFLQKQLVKLERENNRVSSENAMHQKALSKTRVQLDVIKELLTKPKAQQ